MFQVTAFAQAMIFLAKENLAIWMPVANCSIYMSVFSSQHMIGADKSTSRTITNQSGLDPRDPRYRPLINRFIVI